jgi:hypothetical protein
MGRAIRATPRWRALIVNPSETQDMQTRIHPPAWLCLLLVSLLTGPAAASNIEKSERLVNQHDLSTTVAIGDYFLKQESVLAARTYLARVGRAQNLGADWNAANPYWKQAEEALVAALTRSTRREFSSMEWLSAEWAHMNAAEFSEPDLDLLLAHFNTDVGRKQAMILNHTVAFHVMASLSMAGKIEGSVPGTEAERKRMQDLYNAEDADMRFDHNQNPEGTQFAFSPVGKKYFVNAVLKVSGAITGRLYQTAARLPQQVETADASAVEQAVSAYRRARGA